VNEEGGKSQQILCNAFLNTVSIQQNIEAPIHLLLMLPSRRESSHSNAQELSCQVIMRIWQQLAEEKFAICR